MNAHVSDLEGTKVPTGLSREMRLESALTELLGHAILLDMALEIAMKESHGSNSPTHTLHLTTEQITAVEHAASLVYREAQKAHDVFYSEEERAAP